ncbi:hypothetical protein [Amaricoccus macauensis]|uniref:hypothetical protein n=1 Tax=Amaricoccus macauensis TaxID=57001 RepID=UPI003C7A5C3B
MAAMVKLPFLACLFSITSTVVAAGDGLEIMGQAETVYDWQAERCARWDIPDTPARAWRDDMGMVHLLAGSEETRISSGPSLSRLTRSCEVAHRGGNFDDPGAYDDRVWIASTYREAGRLIALAHVEFHGHRRRDLCPAGDYMACWWNAIVELVSEDGGRSFQNPAGASELVASLPYRPGFDTGQREGYFSPSNILRRGDHLYALIFAEAYEAQKRGACLIRRPVGGGPDDWRAWDGTGFSARFVDPFREAPPEPAVHVCAPVPGIVSTLSSVVRHRGSGTYVAVTPATLRDGDGPRVSGIWWTRSTDLLVWEKPELLLEVPLLWRRDCAAPAAHAYPSLLDESSHSDNFEDIGDDFWLYLVRMPLGEDCSVGPERDLIRFPVSLRLSGAAR